MMYKVLSGIISQRLTTTVAVDLGWISPEQKGFLPGVNGIQEHIQPLQTVVEETKLKRDSMSMAFLDLSNDFGSIPHMIIGELFKSLPIPDRLRALIMDVYSENRLDFVIGKDIVPIFPTAGVRHGDELSTVVFNLASEPLIRAAKFSPGFPPLVLFGNSFKVPAFADDIALITPSVGTLKDTITDINLVSATLGLKFNASKCVTLVLLNGKLSSAEISIAGGAHDYLRILIGAKLLFRTGSKLSHLLDKLTRLCVSPLAEVGSV